MDRLLEAVRRSHAEAWALDAEAHGGAVAGSDDVLLYATGLPSAAWNGGLVLRAATDPDAVLAGVHGFFAVRAEPYGCLIPEELYPDYSDAAQRRGFVPLEQPHPCMALRPSELRATEPPAGLDIRTVTDDSAASDHVDVVAQAFEAPRPVMERLVLPQVDAPGFTHLTGYLDGAPVVVATVLRTADALGVFGVGTLPAARRRGLASVLTAYAIRTRADGADLAWLTPSDGARDVYARLGFTDLPGWRILAPTTR